MTKSEFRRLGLKIIDSIHQELRSNKRNQLTFEEDADYESGRIGGFYIPAQSETLPDLTLCVQVFINFEDPNFILTSIFIPLSDDFMQQYSELNTANDELHGVKVTYNEEINALMLLCEIDSRNITEDNYGKFIINGALTLIENMSRVLEKRLLKGVIATINEL